LVGWLVDWLVGCMMINATFNNILSLYSAISPKHSPRVEISFHSDIKLISSQSVFALTPKYCGGRRGRDRMVNVACSRQDIAAKILFGVKQHSPAN
jgi:hypothetical protein